MNLPDDWDEMTQEDKDEFMDWAADESIRDAWYDDDSED